MMPNNTKQEIVELSLKCFSQFGFREKEGKGDATLLFAK